MFNISFGEFLFFGMIALIILGPEKLLQTLSSIFIKYKNIKKQLDQLQTELENEFELIELKKMMQSELQKIQQTEDQLKLQLLQMQQEIETVQAKQMQQPLKQVNFKYQLYVSSEQQHPPFIKGQFATKTMRRIK
ncbi:twin-arginine translocase subunit TatB [Acinetobacter sp.]|uniref:twin-arginine translocase subunit TatB n=1 Tax=Acinetobacter sp. TaxID=472 RepID=UPI002585B2F2|nr:twin-arginine translocase subunit TatB [Acinetobacter sp.]